MASNGEVIIEVNSNIEEYKKLLNLQQVQAKQLEETCQKIIDFNLKLDVQI